MSMILRDPVHGLVAFEGRCGELVQALLATKEVQRLRRVRQLGLTSLVFPGAEHSRFAHALGAAHVMTRLLARISERESILPKPLRLDEEARDDAVAAALLHDLGHGPFSHLFEQALPGARHHEEWTRDILLAPECEVHIALEKWSNGMSRRVADLLNGKSPFAYLSRAISGTLDVDRADYLLRDSYMSGARYGLYDLDWVLRALSFGEVDGEWVLAIEGRKGLPPVEGFFLGRHFMFQQVYHHKATRAAECLIRGMLERVAELLQDGDDASLLLSPALGSASRGEALSLEEYLQLDDSTIMHACAIWARHRDPVLSELAGRFHNRVLPKTIPLSGDEAAWKEAEARAKSIVGDQTLSRLVRLDVPCDTPYAEPDERSADGMWVSLSHQPMRRLGDVSFILGELRNKVWRNPRLIVPAEFRSAVIENISDLLVIES